MRHGDTSFLLRAFDTPGFAGHFVMHLLVEDADAWHEHVRANGVVERFQVVQGPAEDQPWDMRDFTLTDPAGVLWRIAQNTPPRGGEH